MFDMKLPPIFLDAVIKVFMDMANIEVKADGEFYSDKDDIESYGFSTIISFIGKDKGRLLLDMEPSLAIKFAQNVTGEEYTSNKEFMVLASISEMNNIIAGNANTNINNKLALGLRLMPPIVFTGEDAIICIPKISSVSMNCITDYGKLKVNIAFERSVQ